MSQAFANLDGLVRLSRNEGVDIRRPLLRVLTDLYVQEPTHTREEEQQYSELALRLLPDVDRSTRAAVARKLAAYPYAPRLVLAVLRKDDEPEIAGLFAGYIEPLAEQPEPAGAKSTAIVAASPFIASDDEDDGDAIEEPEPPIASAADIGEAFLKGSRRARVTFLIGGGAPAMPASQRLCEFPDRPGAGRRLERAAMQRNVVEFARELRLSMNISTRTATLIAQDASGEALVVAAKALGINTATLVPMLLFLNPKIGESVERVFSLVDLHEEITWAAVEPVVAAWQAESAARSARFQPSLAADATGVASARDGARPDTAQAERQKTAVEAKLRAQSST